MQAARPLGMSRESKAESESVGPAMAVAAALGMDGGAPDALPAAVVGLVAGKGGRVMSRRGAGGQGRHGPQLDAAAIVFTGVDLRRWRRAVGLTQAELARRLGYSNHTICHWETSAKRVPPAQYRRILEELLTAKEEQEALRLYRARLEVVEK